MKQSPKQTCLTKNQSNKHIGVQKLSSFILGFLFFVSLEKLAQYWSLTEEIVLPISLKNGLTLRLLHDTILGLDKSIHRSTVRPLIWGLWFWHGLSKGFSTGSKQKHTESWCKVRGWKNSVFFDDPRKGSFLETPKKGSFFKKGF